MPTTEAGKRLLDNLAAEYDDRHMEPYRASIAAIEAEAREKMLVAWEAAVENAIRIEIAAERERLAEAVRGLESSEWRDCPGNCHDHTIAAVIAIVRGEQAMTVYTDHPNDEYPFVAGVDREEPTDAHD